MKREGFSAVSYYHIYNRSVIGTTLFRSLADFDRFYQGMFVFNNAKSHHRSGDPRMRWYEIVRADIDRDPLVDIVCFDLQPTHFHMMIKPLQTNGVAKFFHKLSMGYANYYNTKYERTGHLFESRFKAVPIDHQEHFEHLPRYIHLNALDELMPTWREGKVSDWNKALQILDSHPWSSHHLYSGHGQTFDVVNEALAKQFYRSPEEYLEDLKRWSGRAILQQHNPII